MASNPGTDVRAGFSTITHGTLFLLGATLGYVLLNFVSRVVLVRNISTGDWSAFAFGLTLASLLSALGTIGLPSAIARSVPHAQSDEERRTIVRGGLIIGAVAAFAVSLALWLSSGAIGNALGEPNLVLVLEILPIAVGTSITATLISSVFQGFENVTPNAVFVQLVNPALFLVFLGVALFVPPGWGGFFGGALVAYALANAVALGLLVVYLVTRLPRRFLVGPSVPGALERLLRFAAPLFAVGVFGSIIGSGDTLVLGIFHPGEVGTYAASLTLARLVILGVSALAYIFLPVASRFVKAKDADSIRVLYTTTTKWVTLFALPLFLVFFFVPSGSLGLVYGPNYTQVVLPLQIVVAGAFVTTLMGPVFSAQIAYGYTRLLTLNALVAAAVDVVLSVALAPREGYVGAAIAWASANIVYDALSLIQVATLTGTHPFRRDFLVPVAATAIPVGGLFWLLAPRLFGWLLPLAVLAVAGAYIGVILATKSIDEGDGLLLEVIERLFGRTFARLRRIGRRSMRSPP